MKMSRKVVIAIAIGVSALFGAASVAAATHASAATAIEYGAPAHVSNPTAVEY